jgi:hypothetical protein
MSALCAELHAIAWRGTLHSCPFDVARLPTNGIYALFEAGEESHGGKRIVRVGTHTGDRQLRSRMLQHFVNENKDRSIFRKNVGRALLNKAGDPFLAEWERDRTSRADRARFGEEPDPAKRRAIEADVTKYIQGRFTFVVFRVEDKNERMTLESKTISTLSRCEECQPSEGWLGLRSPKDRIRESGLWLVNELYKEPLSSGDVDRLATHLT